MCCLPRDPPGSLPLEEGCDRGNEEDRLAAGLCREQLPTKGTPPGGGDGAGTGKVSFLWKFLLTCSHPEDTMP